MFDEAEVELEKSEELLEQEEITYKRNKPKRAKLPEDLPCEEIIYDLSDDDKTCDCCSDELHQMGEGRGEQLEYVPAQVKVIEHVRLKFSCRACDKTGTEVKI